jgi:hypothetical protein
LESDANVTVARERHLQKHSLSSTLTDDGMQIDEIDEQEQKADLSINESLEPTSNVTVERAVQP